MSALPPDRGNAIIWANTYFKTVQIIGYAARAVSHFHPKSTTVYALQTLLILLAPTLYAATIYMTMGRVIMSVHAQHLSIVPVDKMTKIFVCGDILSFILQAASKFPLFTIVIVEYQFVINLANHEYRRRRHVRRL